MINPAKQPMVAENWRIPRKVVRNTVPTPARTEGILKVISLTSPKSFEVNSPDQ